jgi:anaerobic nitric oxide reductase transcription regulator
VRELENVVARAVLRAAATPAGEPPHDTVTITTAHLDVAPAAVGADSVRPGTVHETTPETSAPFRDRVDAFERRLITEAIERNGGNWAAAARALGMHRSNLHHLATRLGMRERS